MPDMITISKTLNIRDCGFNEHWLQDEIYKNPSILGLGELEVVSREKQQSSGGRLDLLLKDPVTDSMYEVELMLGETDETHIIRTIEYWDLEKRRRPQRQHFPVLVAESITNRFYNVIQLFSLAIPMIAIRVNILDVEGKRVLHFAKILDTYQEPEDDSEGSDEIYDESWWRAESPWTLENAKTLLKVIAPVYKSADLHFVKNYIAINVNKNNYFRVHKRGANKSLVQFWNGETDIVKVMQALDEKDVSYLRKNQSLRLTVDQKMIETNAELFRHIALLVQNSWQT